MQQGQVVGMAQGVSWRSVVQQRRVCMCLFCVGLFVFDCDFRCGCGCGCGCAALRIHLDCLCIRFESLIIRRNKSAEILTAEILVPLY